VNFDDADVIVGIIPLPPNISCARRESLERVFLLFFSQIFAVRRVAAHAELCAPRRNAVRATAR
jgi:hypothetical protein